MARLWYSLPYPSAHQPLPSARMALEPWTLFLDSCASGGQRGRFDILLRRPRWRVWQQGGQTFLAEGGNAPKTSNDTLISVLRAIAREEQERIRDLDAFPVAYPFAEGFAGFFSYDWGRQMLGIPGPDDPTLPTAALAWYDSAYLVDHLRREAGFWGHADDLLALRAEMAEPSDREETILGDSDVQPLWSAELYRSAFAKVQAYLRAGDVYQLNLAQAFQANWSGTPWQLYRALRQRNPAPFAAFFALPEATLLSLSPERLVSLCDGQLQARPIKGTRRRDPDPLRDRARAAELCASPKDRAENVMIVDLLRNDLGRVAELGSVRVSQFCALESFPAVHHLVSSVEARLHPDCDPWDVLLSCLPGGSVTGAPKRHAVELLQSLEAKPRGFYCGSLGYVDARGRMDWNILIRSLSYRAGQVQYWGGGGIVMDSETDAEYQESLDKVAFITATLKAGRDTVPSATAFAKRRAAETGQ
ncbi:aminodeoxychorismate synthase, component I [Acidithiobacillus caldus]|uniref:aminodeoxychorismate synthase n=1 Tax=Acidithiobacillus caldus TaxID=33059 RepID=A0A1E7YVD3_9PROT|nr:aminodeoxychorismate synthase, component I [Acidithiobacillus caldus]